MDNNLEQVFLGEGVSLTSNSDLPIDLAEFDGKLYFPASQGQIGEELFVTDGTTEGTQIVADVNRLTFRYGPDDDSTVPGDTVYISESANGSSNPRSFTEFNGRLYFQATDESGASGIIIRTEEEEFGRELYVTDGTTEGTELVKDIYPGAYAVSRIGIISINSSNPSEFTEFNDKLYFSANNRDGRELFVTDGTAEGTEIVADINSGGIVDRYSSYDGSYPSDLTVFNGQLYFAATSGDGDIDVFGNLIEGEGEDSGRELYITDGTNEGTRLFSDLNPGDASSDPSDLIVFNDRLYFAADNGTSGRELFISDGTVEGTRLFADLNPDGSSNPSDLTIFNDKLYFAADNGTSGLELYVTDGTTEGTRLFADLSPGGSSNPSDLTVFNDKLYFVADDGTSGRELFVTDGTVEGTKLVADINPGSGSSNPYELTVVGDELFLVASSDGSSNLELFKLTADSTISTVTQPLNPITQPLNPIVGTDFDDDIVGTQGNDGITGGSGNDVLSGRAGNDALDGGAGNDALDGGIGTDTAVYQFAPAGVNVSLVEGDAGGTPTDGYGNTDSLLGFENAIGSEFDDNLTGNSNSNSLTGRGGNDGIVGGSGDDFLTGGLGADNLTGGAGSDLFVYLDASEGGDTISDFAVGTDKIALLASGFGGGAAGELPASSFAISNGATTSEQRFIFDRSSSELSFDADGSGSSPQQLIATLNGVSDISAADIVVI